MDWYSIPFRGKFIVYRPLKRLAFVGNAALVDCLANVRPENRSDLPPGLTDFLDQIGFWAPGLPPPETPTVEFLPTTAVLLMTNRCSLRCVYCYANAGASIDRSLRLSDAKRLIDFVARNAQAQKVDQFSVSLHGGGEPTESWAVLEGIVEFGKSHELSCRFSLTSNGVWSSSQTDFILKNFSSVTISCDGIQEVQDAQRPLRDGGGSHQRVMETLATLDAAGLDYGIRMTVTPQSVGSLAESVAFLCKNTRVKAMQVDPTYTTSRGVYGDMDKSFADHFARRFLDALDVANRSQRTLTYSAARPWVAAAAFCTAATSSVILNPDGALVTCFEAYDSRHPHAERFTVGRVTESEVVVDKEKLRAYLAREAERRAGCRKCFCYWHCAGDCAMRASTAPVGQESLRCQVTRSITTELLARSIEASGGVWSGLRAHLADYEGAPSS